MEDGPEEINKYRCDSSGCCLLPKIPSVLDRQHTREKFGGKFDLGPIPPQPGTWGERLVAGGRYKCPSSPRFDEKRHPYCSDSLSLKCTGEPSFGKKTHLQEHVRLGIERQ